MKSTCEKSKFVPNWEQKVFRRLNFRDYDHLLSKKFVLVITSSQADRECYRTHCYIDYDFLLLLESVAYFDKFQLWLGHEYDPH